MLETYFLEFKRRLEKDNYDRFLGYVSEEKKDRLLRFHIFEDAQRSLLGDVLARHVICKKTAMRNADLRLVLNEYWKPVLSGHSNIHFSISHSGSGVVCAVGDSPVGIDIEGIKPINLGVAERILSEIEYKSFINLPEDQKLKYFYMIWTLKESYIKALGKGLSISLNSFSFDVSIGKIYIVADNQTKNNYFYWSLIGNEIMYAICALTNKNADLSQNVVKKIPQIDELF